MRDVPLHMSLDTHPAKEENHFLGNQVMGPLASWGEGVHSSHHKATRGILPAVNPGDLAGNANSESRPPHNVEICATRPRSSETTRCATFTCALPELPALAPRDP